MVRNTEKESANFQMEQLIKALSKMINLKAKEIYQLNKENTMDSFSKENFKEKACSNGKMDLHMKAIIKMIKNMGLENTLILKEKCSRDNGETE